MKTTHFIAVCAMAVLASFAVNAQKLKPSGNLSEMSSAKEYKLEFYYDNVQVGKYKDEDDYIAKKVAEYDEKEPGRGEKWKIAWKEDRDARYHVKFEELFNKYLEKPGVTGGRDVESDHVIKVYTTFIEPGFNVGVMRQNAYVSMNLVFVKGGKEVGKLSVEKSPGGTAFGYDFDTGVRISEAYAKAGKEVGAYLAKKVHK